MQILIWIVRAIVIVLFVWFAARNAHVVELNGYLDASLKAPLALILLAFFGGGLLLGLLASLPSIFRLKREVRKLNRALQQKTREADAALPAISANAAMGAHRSDAPNPQND
jgi:uncharacterized integral membrane protein